MNSYDNPFWDFNNGGKRPPTSGIISKIGATYIYASSQGQRTHSARTNSLSGHLYLEQHVGWSQRECLVLPALLELSAVFGCQIQRKQDQLQQVVLAGHLGQAVLGAAEGSPQSVPSKQHMHYAPQGCLKEFPV